MSSRCSSAGLRPRPLRGSRRLRPRAAQPRRLGLRSGAAHAGRDRPPRQVPAVIVSNACLSARTSLMLAGARRSEQRRTEAGCSPASPTSSSSWGSATTWDGVGGERRRAPSCSPSLLHRCSTAKHSARRSGKDARRCWRNAERSARCGPPTSITATRRAAWSLLVNPTATEAEGRRCGSPHRREVGRSRSVHHAWPGRSRYGPGSDGAAGVFSGSPRGERDVDTTIEIAVRGHPLPVRSRRSGAGLHQRRRGHCACPLRACR